MNFSRFKTISTKTKAFGGCIAFGVLYSAYKMYNNFNYPSLKSINDNKLNVIIIGGSKGIGFGLAKYFINYGDNVIITSRKQNSLDNALNKLTNISNNNNNNNISGIICDITDKDSLINLYNEFKSKDIDIIINNAGYIGSNNNYLWNIECNDIEKIIKTNLYGTLISCKLAIQSYIKYNKTKTLHIFNMAGAGTRGEPSKTVKYLTYSTTKGGIGNIMSTLNAELKENNLDSNIKVHLMNPGMVWTDMLATGIKATKQKDGIKNVAFINMLTSTTDEVASWYVPILRGIATANNKCYDVSIYGKNVLITFMGKLLGYSILGKNKDKFIDKSGNFMIQPN